MSDVSGEGAARRHEKRKAALAIAVETFRVFDQESKVAAENAAQRLKSPFKPMAVPPCDDLRAALSRCFAQTAPALPCEAEVHAYSTCAESTIGRHGELVSAFEAARLRAAGTPE